MSDARALLRAGGIVPVTREVPADERTGIVRARRYPHPALPGRVVVRLSADAIAPGADIEMKTLGFERPTVSEPLGRQRFRALGFPGWALVHDPKRAKFALEVMQEFKRAAARVKSKPGHARDEFVAIAQRLARSVPHFLPSFWEEAGRAFLAEGNTSYGAQSFEKARQVELEHKLAIDEAVRSEVFLEFALGGALTVKSLAAYGKELERTLGAPKAYPRFSELALRRTLGGMPPWTGMAKDVRALAKAAKLDGDAEDERFLGELLEASSIAKASSEFWASYRDALVRMARKSGATRARLLHLFPTPGGPEFRGWWLDLLIEVGVIDLLESGGKDSGEKGAAAAWLAKMLGYAPQDARLVGLLERLAPRIVSDGEPLQLVHGKAWAARADLDLCERALELSVPTADPPEMPETAWSHGRTLFSLGGGFRCDPLRVAADARFGPFLSKAVAAAMGSAEFERASIGKEGVAAARRAWLAEQVSRLGAGLVGMESVLPVLEKKTTAATFVEFPELRDALAAVAPSAALARVLRGGIFDEFGWPALEAAVVDLGGPKGVKLGGAFPNLVVYTATKAIVVGPKGRALEHDLHVPAPTQPDALYFVGGQLFVTFFDRTAGGSRGYWSGAPHEVFAIEAPAYLFRHSVPLAATLPDGSVTFAGRKVVPGDTQFAKVGDVVADGTGYWVKTNEAGKLRLHELDPATGIVGRASWPSVVERSLSPGDEVVDIFLLPTLEGTERSPLGSKDGLTGAWTVRNGLRRECVSVDGRRARSERSGSGLEALVTFPHDGRPRIGAARSDWSQGQHRLTTQIFSDGIALGLVTDGGWYTRGSSFTPPLPFWHLLTPRDEPGSGVLRTIGDAEAEELLVAACVDRERGDAGFSATRQQIDALLPAVTDRSLKDGIIGAAMRAAELGSDLARLVKGRLTPEEGTGSVAAEVVGGIDLNAIVGAIPLFVERNYGRGDVSREISAASRWLAGGRVDRLESTPLSWELWLGSIRALAMLLASQGVASDKREVLLRLLRLWQRSTMAGDLSRLRVARIHVPADSSLLPSAPRGYAWLSTRGESRYFVRHLVNEKGRVALRVIERTNDGTFRLPEGATLAEEKQLTGTGDDAWLGVFLDEFERRGPPAWDPAAADVLANQTGLSRAEATLLWAGLPGLATYLHDFLGKGLRTALGLKVSEAKVAADPFRRLGTETYLALFAAAAPEDPRTLWEPPSAAAHGAGSAVARLAAAWSSRFGHRVAVREDLLVAVKRDLSPLPLPPALLLRALMDPETEPCMQLEGTTTPSPNRERTKGDGATFAGPTIVGLAKLVPYLFGALPVGDPYRTAIPRLLQAARARLASPTLILPLGQAWFGGELRSKALALMDAIGGESTSRVGTGSAEPSLTRDNGTVILSLSENGNLLAAFRPSRVADYGNEPHLSSVSQVMYGRGDVLRSAAFLSSDGCAALAQRIRETPVPEGQWEANPRVASRGTAEKARAKLNVSEDAAILYLQLLALPEPTHKNVRTWNAWDAGTLKTASSELLAKKLVVEGKRERAGRDVFLPGAWDRVRAVEAWKLSLYGTAGGSKEVILPSKPLHLLFEDAWMRVESGDKPAFEEV